MCVVRSKCDCSEETAQPAALDVTKILPRGLEPVVGVGCLVFARDTVCVMKGKCWYDHAISLLVHVVALC